MFSLTVYLGFKIHKSFVHFWRLSWWVKNNFCWLQSLFSAIIQKSTEEPYSFFPKNHSVTAALWIHTNAQDNQYHCGSTYVLACVALHAFRIIISYQNTQIYSLVQTYTHTGTQTKTTQCSCLLDEQYCQHIRLGPVGRWLYGFMLHHQAVSHSVDYNSQKPLIKRCAWEHFSLLLYLFRNEHSIDLLTVQRSASEPNTASFYKLAGLWNAVQQEPLIFVVISLSFLYGYHGYSKSYPIYGTTVACLRRHCR